VVKTTASIDLPLASCCLVPVGNAVVLKKSSSKKKLNIAGKGLSVAYKLNSEPPFLVHKIFFQDQFSKFD
jgi:hypothetical protein